MKNCANYLLQKIKYRSVEANEANRITQELQTKRQIKNSVN